MLAFASDCYIDKVIDISTAKLNLTTQLDMLMNNSGHKEIVNLIKLTSCASGSYSPGRHR